MCKHTCGFHSFSTTKSSHNCHISVTVSTMLHITNLDFTCIVSTSAVGRKLTSQGPKISELIDYTRLLLGLVSYFFPFRPSWPVFEVSRFRHFTYEQFRRQPVESTHVKNFELSKNELGLKWQKLVRLPV